MVGAGLGLDAILRATEDASPVESVDVVARNLEERFAACEVAFWFVDLSGQEAVRLPRAGAVDQARGDAERIPLSGSVYDHVLRSQRLYQEDGGAAGCRMVAPVTNRGDCIGALDLSVPYADDAVREAVAQAAHALAYIVVTDRRFTDLYHWGRRTTAVSLAAEIQHQLLPSASCCEAAQFTLACGLVPTDDIGGDTYDYALDEGTLHLSITDAMGHDTASALLATLAVNAVRGARRARHGVLDQAYAAHKALTEHAPRGMVTGQLLCASLETGACDVINAGHPWPLRLRAARLQEVTVKINLPFGVPVPVTYEVQRLQLEPGDRLVLLTDGMTEHAAPVDLPAIVHDTRDEHPREVVRALTGAIHEACGGSPPDDATTIVLDWHGRSGRRHSDAGADL